MPGNCWLVLALAVATGRPWLEQFQTVAGPVLILDNELHPETLAHRLPQVAAALGVGLDELGGLEVQSLRGRLRDLFAMESFFAALAPERYALIILDAFYRFMPRDMDENDNGTMATLYNRLDALADRLGSCFVLIHHTTKGNQAGKAVTDVGAGAGSQSRATDTHVILRPHATPGAVVLDAAVRSWAPVEPVALRWAFPVWHVAPELDPADLRSERPNKKKDAPPPRDNVPPITPWSPERFVREFISEVPVTIAQLRERAAAEPGLSWRRVADLLSLAEGNGAVRRVRLPGRGGRWGYLLPSEEGDR